MHTCASGPGVHTPFVAFGFGSQSASPGGDPSLCSVPGEAHAHARFAFGFRSQPAPPRDTPLVRLPPDLRHTGRSGAPEVEHKQCGPPESAPTPL
eukprot:13067226-Alexandrium_andersonii.AAC.1